MSAQKSGLSSGSSRVPRLSRLSNTAMSCDNLIYGCTARLSSPEERLIHRDLCDFNPNTVIKCNGCQKEVRRAELRRHNCIEELRAAVDELKDMITGLEAKVNEQTARMNEAKHLLEATPQPILTHRQLREKWYESCVREEDYNEPKRELVFESEPALTRKGTEKVKQNMSSNYSTGARVVPEVMVCGDKRMDGSDDSDEFPMYGSLKYKYLSALSREYSGQLPPIDYDLDQSLALDPKKRNKEKLIDVIKDNEFSGDKPSLVRLRSWSERHSRRN